MQRRPAFQARAGLPAYFVLFVAIYNYCVLSIDFHRSSCDFGDMAKVQPPQVLTANRLKTGDVVYWTAGQWTEAFGQAEVFIDPEAARAALQAAEHFVAGRIVVAPYLFPVRVAADGARPLEEREVIRAAGPTVRRDLGKQAAHV
jgi:Protein of unknown function (DUF2849)